MDNDPLETQIAKDGMQRIAQLIEDVEELKARETSDIALSARVYNNANISLANGAVTLITFNSERWDTDNMHSLSVNPSRLTCVTPGKYIAITNIEFDTNSSGDRSVYMRKNNSIYIAQVFQPPTTGFRTALTLSTHVEMVAGDYLEVLAYQNTGSALNCGFRDWRSPEFMMVRIGK